MLREARICGAGPASFRRVHALVHDVPSATPSPEPPPRCTTEGSCTNHPDTTEGTEASVVLLCPLW
jgi:hypothetical protein